MLSSEYIRERDEHEDKGEYHIDDVGDQYPEALKYDPKPEYISKGPIGREEPPGEHDEGCKEEGKDSDCEISNGHERGERGICRIRSGFCCFCRRDAFDYRMIQSEYIRVYTDLSESTKEHESEEEASSGAGGE